MATALATLNRAKSVPAELKQRINSVVSSNQRQKAVLAAKAAKVPFIASGAAFVGGFGDAVLEKFGFEGVDIMGVPVDVSEGLGVAAVLIGAYEGSADLTAIGAGLSCSLAKKVGKQAGKGLLAQWDKMKDSE